MNGTAHTSVTPGIESAAVDTEAVYRKVTWRLIPLLFLCYVLNYVDRINIGYAQLQMRPDLGFSDAVYGLSASMFFVGYFFFEVPSNLFLQKIGARKTILRIMVCWGLVSAATMFVRTPVEFYLARFLLGVFEAGFFPGIVLYLTFWYPAERRARIIAMFMVATVVAGIIAGPMSGWILQNLNGVHGLRGWQWMYLIEGLPSSIIGIVVYLCLADQPDDARWLSNAEREIIRLGVFDGSRGVAPGGRDMLGVALRAPKVYLFSFLYFAISCGAYVISFWMPTMIQGLGVTNAQQIGLYSLIPYTLGAVAMVWWGRRSDSHKERRWHFAVPAFLCAAGLVLTTWTGGHLWLSVALIAIATASVVSAFPIFWAAATAHLSKQASAAGIAVITSLGSLAGVVAPYAMGLAKTLTGSLGFGLYLVAMMLVVGGFVMLLTRYTRGHDWLDAISIFFNRRR